MIGQARLRHRTWPRWITGGAVAAAVVGLAACGTKTTAGASGSPSAPASPSANAKITVAAASVPGAGTVLVSGAGMTLYALTSEAGGHVTCTDSEMSNGTACTSVWPDSEIPAGMTAGIAGSGISAALLGTATGPTGDKYVTYAGYPLYTFARDTAGTAKGEGITSFGGTWEVLSPAGTLVPKSAFTAVPSPSPSKASSGYGY